MDIHESDLDLDEQQTASQKGGSDPLNRDPFWKFVVPTVSNFAWLPESLARAFCAESLDTSPTRLYADPVQCLADLEAIRGLEVRSSECLPH